MKVNLINFYFRQEEYPNRYYLGTLRLAEYLMSFGIEVDILPIDLAKYKEFNYKIICGKYDMIGISDYSWLEEAVIYASNEIRKNDLKVKIVIGGPQVDVTDLSNWNDEIFIRGEGERALLNICKCILRGDSIEKMCLETPNVFTKKYLNSEKKEEKINIVNPLFTNIDIPIEDRNFLWYETCRGCAFNCGYCGHRTREKVDCIDLDIIREEIKQIGLKKFKNIFIIDPNFGATQQRAKVIIEMFNKYAPTAKLGLYFRPEFIDDEMISILKNANIDCIRIGIQTTNKNVPLWLRSNSLKHITRELPKLAKNKIKWRAELIVGLPGDDYCGLIKSMDDIENLHPYEYYCYHLTAIPGTPLYKLVDNYHANHWIRVNKQNQVVESDTYTAGEMREMLDYSNDRANEYNNSKITKGEYNNEKILIRY